MAANYWRAPQAPWQARMVLLGCIWGFSFLFIKVADESLAPLQVAFGRLICGSAALMLLLALRRGHLPRRSAWGHLFVAGFLLNALPFTAFSYGETHTSAVLAGICNATTALFALPVSVAMIASEKVTGRRLAGLAVGFLGVLVVLGVWTSVSGSSLEGNLLCLGGAASYGVGIPYTRRFLSGRSDSALSLAAGQLLAGTLELAVVVPFVTAGPAHLPARVIVSVVLLGAFGTGIAYVLNHGIVREAGASVSAMVTYLVPLFSTVAGVLFLHEGVSWFEPVGAVVILLGAAITQRRRGAVSEQAAAPPVAALSREAIVSLDP